MTGRTLRRHGGGLGFLAVLFVVAWSSGIQPADAAQFTVVNDVITMTSGNNGFYFWTDTLKGPANWVSPNNFYNGQLYCRFEVIEQPTTTPFSFSFCVWGKNGSENASYQRANLGGAGSVATFNSSLSSYWQHTTNGGVDFSNENNFLRWGLPTWVENGSVLLAGPGYTTDAKSPAYWAHKEDWFPLKVRVQVEAVSLGSTFAGFPVPEPSTFALLATGLVSLVAYAWRKWK